LGERPCAPLQTLSSRPGWHTGGDCRENAMRAHHLSLSLRGSLLSSLPSTRDGSGALPGSHSGRDARVAFPGTCLAPFLRQALLVACALSTREGGVYVRLCEALTAMWGTASQAKSASEWAGRQTNRAHPSSQKSRWRLCRVACYTLASLTHVESSCRQCSKRRCGHRIPRRGYNCRRQGAI